MQGYIAALCLVTGAAGYMAGYTRGELYGERTRVVTITETVQYPPAYAATCAAMIEAANGFLPPSREPDSSSPHLP